MKTKFEFDSIMYPYDKKRALKIIVNQYSVADYVDYINKNNIEQAEIIMPDLEFIKACPSLKYMSISPAYNATDEFTFAPLYELPSIKFLNCSNVYGDNEELCADIDISKIKGLEYLSISYNNGVKNIEKSNGLKTLRVRKYRCKHRNLNSFLKSDVLDTLELSESNIQTLKGIEQMKNIQCLYLNYNRTLSNIEDLKRVKGTLKTLYIQNCAKVENFSVLQELENLEALELIGNNKIPNLDFLKNLKNLKTFVFEYNIISGDLIPCLELSNVHCLKNRKHYNYKNCELPKGEYIFGNEQIEEWRRIE